MSNQSRLDALKAMADKRPGDPMVHYGLGLEYRKAGDLEAAAAAFRTTVENDPTYTAAFQELGTVLVDLGQREEAARILRAGVEAADRAGAWKAREHLKRLLADLEACSPQPDGFCE